MVSRKGGNVLKHIGNAGIEAMAWAKRIVVSLNLQTERDKLPKTQEHRPLFASGAHLAVNIQRQVQASQASVLLSSIHSRSGTVMSAPARNRTPIKRKEREDERARDSEPPPSKGSKVKGPESIPQIDSEEIADKVYRLMQRDLILERDRTTKLGV